MTLNVCSTYLVQPLYLFSDLPIEEFFYVIFAPMLSLAVLLLLVLCAVVAVGYYVQRKKKRMMERVMMMKKRRRRTEEKECTDCNMVLTRSVSTTTHHPSNSLPIPAYSCMQVLKSEDNIYDDVILSQVQVQANQNSTLESSYTALSLVTLQNQLYAKLNFPDEEGGAVKMEGDGMGRENRASRAGAVVRAAGEREASITGYSDRVNPRVYKELELKTLEVHPYTPLQLNVSATLPAEK